MAAAPIESERPAAPDLYRKLVPLTGIRLLVGTALLVATAVLSLGREAFPRGVEAYLYWIIAGPLLETKVFPPMVVQMIGVGEATGAMDAMLNKIADFYDDEVDTAVAGLTSLIEPIMMVFLGVVVGGFLIAMYLPIFNIAGAVQGG